MTEKTPIQRVTIDRVRPEIDSGRFPIKRTVGEKVKVRADIITDGHDAISGLLLFRHDGATRGFGPIPTTFRSGLTWRGKRSPGA